MSSPSEGLHGEFQKAPHKHYLCAAVKTTSSISKRGYAEHLHIAPLDNCRRTPAEAFLAAPLAKLIKLFRRKHWPAPLLLHLVSSRSRRLLSKEDRFGP